MGLKLQCFQEAVGESECLPMPIPPETDCSALGPMTVAKVGRYKHLQKQESTHSSEM